MAAHEPDRERGPGEADQDPREPETMPEESGGVTLPEPGMLPEDADVTVPEPEPERS
jgi:hypothetical protein